MAAAMRRLHQTMLRVKDPRVSVPFYTQHFDMTLVHWMRFPALGQTVYYLERQREGQQSPACTLESTSLDCEKYLLNMTGSTLALMHTHGSEADPNFKLWSGNTGKDASGDLYADEPAYRGFGHIAFNVDDVYEACEKLEKADIKFQKKPDEGRMKGLAFALDPDGYWVEVVKRVPLGWPEYYNLSQTMLRVKDGPKSVDFYTKHLGMTLVSQRDFPQYKFSLFFLASITPEEFKAAFDAMPEEEKALHKDGYDPKVQNSLSKTLWNTCLELTWNHGTENQDEFNVHTGNTAPYGFSQIGFLVDDVAAACAQMTADGVKIKDGADGGSVPGVATVYDPDMYCVQLIGRDASFKGSCDNY
eukprot:TRINITY_DN5014_c0_g1_i2.p1 TRINITY_DN5014_c0_g1~~TRINITY_DN5014_c0_g1_i2.p1  ORF type:complete len:359 (+),score=70.25 TRINITY_DN5014_c0_g1_i2:70-1146(+)